VQGLSIGVRVKLENRYGKRAKILPTNAAKIAEQAMEQARGAADVYFEYLKRTIADTPSGGNEFAEKLKGYAEKNITMTQNYLQQLSQARNFQDVVRIQSDFMQSLMKAAGEQTSSLAEAYTKTAADAAKKSLSGMS
jgi:hypothetical protein